MRAGAACWPSQTLCTGTTGGRKEEKEALEGERSRNTRERGVSIMTLQVEGVKDLFVPD